MKRLIIPTVTAAAIGIVTVVLAIIRRKKANQY